MHANGRGATPFKRGVCFRLKEGLQREEGRGTLKEQTTAWLIEPTMGICAAAEYSRLDRQWEEEAEGECFQTGNKQSSNVRRVDDNKCEQAGERQRTNYFEESDSHERTDA